MLTSKKTVIGHEDEIVLSHKLEGVQIRYTTDGSKPDSTSNIYQTAFTLDSTAVVKTFAFKEGWEASKVKTFTFYKKGFVPKDIKLTYDLDVRFTGNGATSLIDHIKGDRGFSPTAWIGVRETPLEAIVHFGDDPPLLSEIMLGYGYHKSKGVNQPESIEIWGGEEENSMTLLATQKQFVEQKGKPWMAVVEEVQIPLQGAQYPFYKVIVHPRVRTGKKKGKGIKQWVIVDQVFFY